MSKWLKFSNMAINSRYISKIYVSPEKIQIRVDDSAHEGSFSGGFLFMSGEFNTKYHDYVTVEKKDNDETYNRVKKWIDDL